LLSNRCAYLFVVIIAKSKEGARNDYQDVVEQLKDIGDGPVIPEDYLETPQFKELISDLPKPKLALNAVGGKRTVTEMARNLA
jgi:trans-2-enoyl-CoA reductase